MKNTHDLGKKIAKMSQLSSLHSKWRASLRFFAYLCNEINNMLTLCPKQMVNGK